ncbi:ABC transporter ATP-binding protein [Micromonospora yangpuensis]|uniref:Energy-coupling factor transport system ATP-binding protein n=1 Tax=Micromonospora yangpuensis TaxID=683228 RepID=A0A1C6VGL0_9ACTN|nr:ABC transporter ATP-binding protein [Micromonospora yangpuensis]GGL98964.1 cobalt ABC transporter ATP-binding protein [Micromonospora yangpuensis]SCL65445.1 energy-coupling factor transport system ATP-binding protein [Micromonospora yangpuensis]
MIEFDRVTVRYADSDQPTLRNVTLRIDEGELCLVVGRTGTGKSTLLRAVNGLVPHFTGGTLHGTVTVDGRDTRHHPPRDLADVVGVVGQDPLAGFVTDTVEEELAYGMEQLALPATVMRKRVEETLDLLGIAELRDRPLRTLSGGQQQRVAIGAVLTAHPRVLVLDEPTSALDPTAAEDVLAVVTRLVHDLGVTVVLAEHRLERVVQYADRLLHLPGDGRVVSGDPATVLAGVDIVPPLIELGRLAGWTPLPLSVRDARRHATDLRHRLTATASGTAAPGAAASGGTVPSGPTPGAAAPPAVLTARKIVVRYPGTVAVAGVDLDLHPGRIVALMGRNGSGKSSLLWAVQGSGPRQGGTVTVVGPQGAVDPKALPPGRARRQVGLVPQTPGDLLYLETVDAECGQADRETGTPAGSCRALLDQLAPGLPGDRHPRDLSEGQRLALALAVQLTAAPPVVLLDEPTRGLDYRAKRQFAAIVRRLAADGRAVVVATHDVELVASLADRVVVLAEGEIVADGSTTEVMLASPAFAPQVAKVLAPAPWLTVDQVTAALGTDGSPS